MLPRKLEVDASLTIDTPHGRMILTGGGASMELEVGTRAELIGLFRSRSSVLRHTGQVGEILENAGLTLYITASGRPIASIGAGVNESGLMGLAGIRGLRLHYGGLLRSALS